jgi:DNA adenine methylase
MMHTMFLSVTFVSSRESGGHKYKMKPITERSFLKWAGNKYQILEHIKATLPKGKRLIEPFAGSGVVSLNADHGQYLLADKNKDLINLFLVLQNMGVSFINYCQSFFTEENNSEKRFYEFRETFNSRSYIPLKTALFVYLNRHAYNGLCRYNSKGHFNTPFGRYKKPYFPKEEMLHFFSMSKKAVFKAADFRDTMRSAEYGDVIYCDPPYVPLSDTANFTSYSKDGFNMDDQADLAQLAKECANRGVPVLISNHATKFTLKLYEDAKITKLSVQRFISCNGNNRGKAEEILALFQGESDASES